MLWFAVAAYVLLSPVACLLIGGAIRVREVERRVEEAPEPVAAASAAPARALVPHRAAP